MKRTNLARLMAAMMVVCMVVAMILPTSVFATSSTDAANNVKGGVLQVNLIYTDDSNNNIPVGWGTGFLVNDTFVVTCDHVVSMDDDELAAAAEEAGKTVAEFKSRLSVSVTVSRDVTVPASIYAQSFEMDFAILKLNNALVGKTPLKIRNVKANPVKQAESVYGVGFPSISAAMQAYNTFTGDDATITNGIVNKVALGINGHSGANTNYIQTSCNLDYGNSGGPMIDANGAVIGVCQSIIGDSATEYFKAVDIQHVIEVMEPLGIQFEYDNGEQPVPEVTEAPTQAATEAPTQAATEVVTLPPVEPGEPGEPDGPNLVLILGIAAAAVVLIVVAVVVLMAGGKKKAAPAPAAHVPPVAPAGGHSGFAPVAPTYPAGDAGETSVLSGGAGETTVLSNRGSAVSGGTLIRKRNGEVININAEQFVIGRERKSVNYCIADNTSVSRTHVRLNVRNGMVYITDLGAANGTFINGVKLQPRQEMALKNGDKITLADEELEYKG